MTPSEEESFHTARRRPPTNPRAGGLLGRADVEAVILDLEQRLEDKTDEYAALCDEASNSKADWTRAIDEALLMVAASVDRPKDADTRMALARTRARSTAVAQDVTGDEFASDLYRTHLITESRVAATKAALGSITSRLDAYRTLAANVRGQS